MRFGDISMSEMNLMSITYVTGSTYETWYPDDADTEARITDFKTFAEKHELSGSSVTGTLEDVMKEMEDSFNNLKDRNVDTETRTNIFCIIYEQDDIYCIWYPDISVNDEHYAVYAAKHMHSGKKITGSIKEI